MTESDAFRIESSSVHEWHRVRSGRWSRPSPGARMPEQKISVGKSDERDRHFERQTVGNFRENPSPVAPRFGPDPGMAGEIAGGAPSRCRAVALTKPG